MKRFYKEVGLSDEAGAYRITLDGKPIKTPEGVVISSPSKLLADVIVQEWATVEESIDMKAMPMTTLLGATMQLDDAAIAGMRDELTRFAETDLLCYYADDEKLLALQKQEWEPVLQMVEEKIGGRFERVGGIMPVDQPAESLAAVKKHIETLNHHELVAYSQMVSLLGSVLLLLAYHWRLIDIEQAINCSQLDERFQAEQWGEDTEAEAARAAKSERIRHLAKYLSLQSE
ncbi:MAG: hypothetical protein MRY32_04890 [Rickettsiales bacterium]|nr:hypothetical protein [Rickettsiales bacterium]